MTKAQFREELDDILLNDFNTVFGEAGPEELYQAVSQVVHKQLKRKKWKYSQKRIQEEREHDDRKKIYYICMEFLMGQSLKNNLYNLRESKMVEDLINERGFTMEDIYDCEPDAGLGNGGLGRLAACYMDALTAQGYDATGFSICYEYGLFAQRIVDGWQVEMPDNWLPGGRVWLEAHPEDTFRVQFYGKYREEWSENGMKPVVENPEVVEAIPYDMFISGAGSRTVNTLRLWRGTNTQDFDMTSFNNGDFTRASQQASRASLLSKVLYPADNILEGKTLRLKQQYFMVSASCQNIVRNHIRLYGTLDNFEDKVAIHINDTHPALVIPELMRIFIDEHEMDWDTAWEKVVKTVSYTNHTVLAEALEKWNENLIETVLPRIYVITKEIDRRFRSEMEQIFPGEAGRVDRMAPIEKNMIHMANLSVIGSHSVNGVSALHSEILKNDLFHDFYITWPDKFTNVTNGIAYRRWLCQSNPKLSELITECIGESWKTNGAELSAFAEFSDDRTVQEEVEKIKHFNKVRFADRVHRKTGKTIDPDSVFIVQAKRLHEYKRQLLNAMRIISRYLHLRDDHNYIERPETYLFAAKAAPNYYMAKEIIRLICKLSEEIDKDPVISKKLRVVFLENYSVSMAEHMMPATDVSEQISLAGKEASGTGNMKLMINGAITVGTLDGANVEMREAVGDENIFIFGQREEDVTRNLQNGYNAAAMAGADPEISAVIDAMRTGFAGTSFSDIADYLTKPSYSIADPYMCIMDYRDYCRAHEDIREAYEDRPRWNSMSIVNIGKAGRFSADRSVREYAGNIWHTKSVSIQCGEDDI
ncbi:MAG: glycogen/starch/alpha-glucan phosphorylase [Anaerovoracaceae bacterium]|jgi:starch phosphorylase